MLTFITIYLIIGLTITILGDYQIRTNEKAMQEMEEVMHSVHISPNTILTFAYIIVITMWPILMISQLFKKR